MLPVIVLIGDGDKLVDPEAHSGKLAALLPNAQQIIIAGAGHMLQHVAPAASSMPQPAPSMPPPRTD